MAEMFTMANKAAEKLHHADMAAEKRQKLRVDHLVYGVPGRLEDACTHVSAVRWLVSSPRLMRSCPSAGSSIS